MEEQSNLQTTCWRKSPSKDKKNPINSCEPLESLYCMMASSSSRHTTGNFYTPRNKKNLKSQFLRTGTSTFPNKLDLSGLVKNSFDAVDQHMLRRPLRDTWLTLFHGSALTIKAVTHCSVSATGVSREKLLHCVKIIFHYRWLHSCQVMLKTWSARLIYFLSTCR